MLQFACHMILHAYKHEFIYLFVSKHREKKIKFEARNFRARKVGIPAPESCGTNVHGYKELKCCLLSKESVGKRPKKKSTTEF
jgi:hypothetical protein